MRRFSTVSCSAIVLAGAVFAASNVGCTVNSNPTSDDAAELGAPSNDDSTSDRGGSASANDGGASGQGDSKLGFSASNVPIDSIDMSKVGEVSIKGSCTVTSDKDVFDCAQGKAAFSILTQSDASRVGMYVVKSFRVEANAILNVTGTLPIVIVALDKMEILGTVRVNASGQHPAPGGFISDVHYAKGNGPGGGGAGSGKNGGGGGSYCGAGGGGNARGVGTAASGGKVYGNPEISPLVGGSAGGATDSNGGTGGGAIQLVAGNSFLLSATGTIHAGGGGGERSVFAGSGGGSGGAILIESESATISGTLSANGGGGGSGASVANFGPGGNNATPDDAPAPGGITNDSASKGGRGSAADAIHGGDGESADTAYYPSGGGGGAGRVRINTKSGQATITGTVSPSMNTPCFSQGTLAN